MYCEEATSPVCNVLYNIYFYLTLTFKILTFLRFVFLKLMYFDLLYFCIHFILCHPTLLCSLNHQYTNYLN